MTSPLRIALAPRLAAVMLSLAAVLTGCSGNPKVADYQAPADGPLARLRLATSFGRAEVFRMDPPNCVSTNAALMARLGEWWFGKTPQQSLQMPLTAVGLEAGEFSLVGLKVKPTVKEDAVSELNIPAGRTFGVRMQTQMEGGFVTSTCEIQFAFEPQPEGDYEAVFHVTPTGCRLMLSRIIALDKADPKRVEEPFTHVEQRCNR